MDNIITNRSEERLAITNRAELDAALSELKKKKLEQQVELKRVFNETVESFTPGNLLKKAFGKVIQPGETRDTILKTLGGIGVGLLTKGIVGKKSTGMAGSLLKKAVNIGAGKLFYKYADTLKAYGTAIYHNILKK